MQWWNNATIQAFRERAQCIIDQYSSYKLEDIELYVNGRMTQGENIADNGGLKQSYRVRTNSVFMLKLIACQHFNMNSILNMVALRNNLFVCFLIF
jgi:predicted metalloendopeptidase